MYPDVLREHIQKCKKATDKPFGVNIPMLYPNVEEIIQIIIEEGVKIVFTSAGNPKTCLYWLLGSAFSMNVPMLFLLLLAGNMIIFIGTRHFDFFRVSQLGLLLFMPFVAQWMSGNLITSSGIIL